tara:strand:- start:3443 stop:3874 length:432 start_codon:yes stop_codon:yes gene_type:complete
MTGGQSGLEVIDSCSSATIGFVPLCSVGVFITPTKNHSGVINTPMIYSYMSEIDDRARQLMKMVSIKELNQSGDNKERDRWKNLRREGSALRVTTDELERLRELFPQYEDWLWKGSRGIDLSKGQVSPEYETADKKLHGRSGE